MLQETELWQNIEISHRFQQKHAQDLRQNQLFAWDKLLEVVDIPFYIIKLTLPM